MNKAHIEEIKNYDDLKQHIYSQDEILKRRMGHVGLHKFLGQLPDWSSLYKTDYSDLSNLGVNLKRTAADLEELKNKAVFDIPEPEPVTDNEPVLSPSNEPGVMDSIYSFIKPKIESMRDVPSQFPETTEKMQESASNLVSKIDNAGAGLISNLFGN